MWFMFLVISSILLEYSVFELAQNPKVSVGLGVALLCFGMFIYSVNK